MIQEEKKSALEYRRISTQIIADKTSAFKEQGVVNKKFARTKGIDIVDVRKDIRPGDETDLVWLDEYFSNAHWSVNYLLTSSFDRISFNYIEVVKLILYLKEKYGVTCIFAEALPPKIQQAIRTMKKM